MTEKLLRGKYVKRSTYQKVCEENKKLLEDIFILVEDEYKLHPEKIIVSMKWRKKFKEDREFQKLMQDFAIEYLEEHPEYDIMSEKFIKPKLDSNPKAFN